MSHIHDGHDDGDGDGAFMYTRQLTYLDWFGQRRKISVHGWPKYLDDIFYFRNNLQLKEKHKKSLLLMRRRVKCQK